MRFLLVIFILLSSEAFAQKSLGRESFMVNVRPVLSGVIGDFYQMITMFPEFPKELIPLIEELNSLNETKENLRSACPHLINRNCTSQINAIRKKLVILKAQSQSLLTQQKMSTGLHLNTLSGLRLITDFDTTLEDLKGYLDNTSLVMSAGLKQKRETFYVLKQMDELKTFVSLAFVEYVPYLYREEFKHFYFNFIHPLEQQLPKATNYEFVNKNIESLNFTLNLLNMSLTKKNKKTPEGMAPYLSTIHNRWNSILRFYYF